MLTLYGDALWESPFVFAAFVTLREKGLDFEMRLLDLKKGEHRQPPFVDSSITAKVPAMDHDGFWLTESQAIVEYLEERFPPPQHAAVLPAAVEDRGRARQILSWLRSGIDGLRAERPTSSIFFERIRTPLTERARIDADRLIRMTERFLSPGSTTLFSAWTIVDAELAISLQRLAINGDPVPDPIRAYVEANWARPTVRAYVEQKRPTRG
jgi:glutathione S-transferase